MQLQKGLQLLKRSGSLEPEDLLWLKGKRRRLLPWQVRGGNQYAASSAQRLKIHAQSRPQDVSGGANARETAIAQDRPQDVSASTERTGHGLLLLLETGRQAGNQDPRALLVVPSFEGHKADKLSDVVGGRWHNYRLRAQVSQCCRHADIKDTSIGA